MTLVEKLTAETQDLKKAYLEKTEIWADTHFDSFSKTTEQEFIDQNGYNPALGKFNVMRHTKSSYARWNQIRSVVQKGKEAYIKKRMLMATEQYESSIKKLAFRIIDKGIDLDTLTMSTESRMETGNITTLITDGYGKSVKAMTILTWGEVNAPHYRYLVK